MADPKELETRIIEALAADYERSGPKNLEARRDFDTKRFTSLRAVLWSPDAIRYYLRERLLLAAEVMLDHHGEKRWRTGVEGAILEGRTSIVGELLDWLEKIPCSECGSEIEEWEKFCGQCGAAVVPTSFPIE